MARRAHYAILRANRRSGPPQAYPKHLIRTRTENHCSAAGVPCLSDSPYGKWISLDGVHPSADGHRVLARAARVEIQKTYGTGPIQE